MSDTYCPHCKLSTEIVFDHSTRHTSSSLCGLVLHQTDSSSSSSSSNHHPNLLAGHHHSSLSNSPSRSANPHRILQALDSISAFSDRLGLVTTIKDRAFEIYKSVEDQKALKGRNQDAVSAACVYIACRQENKPRTVKEICSVVNGATKKEIGRAKEFIIKHLKVEMGDCMEMGTIHASDYLRRFCSNLGMDNQEIKAAQEVVQKSEQLDIRRSPISIAAAVIYIITQLAHQKKPIKDISVVTQVAEGTIKNVFKDFYPHLLHVIPSWFAREEDVKNLHS